MRVGWLFVVLMSACAGMQHEESAPSFSSASSSSYSAPFSQASQSFVVPAHEPVYADVVARPDLLAMNFAIRAGGKTTEAALAKAKAEVELLRAKVAGLAGPINLRLCGFRSELAADEKAHAVVDGVIEIPLEPTADYWARAGLMSRLSIFQKVEPPSKKAADDEADDPAVVGVSPPKFLVREPEKYRAELTQKWVDRARAFSKIAEDSLRLVRCEPPQAISQSMISFEEIALSMRMACQLDIVQR